MGLGGMDPFPAGHTLPFGLDPASAADMSYTLSLPVLSDTARVDLCGCHATGGGAAGEEGGAPDAAASRAEEALGVEEMPGTKVRL